MNIIIINGPNLNLLGRRRPDIYGAFSLEDIERKITTILGDSDVTLRFLQSNNEGKLVSLLHEARYEMKADAVVINPGAYAHTSVAIRDAIEAIEIPVVEVHISNTAAREEFRHHSITAGACVGKIEGLGWTGYLLAVLYLSSAEQKESQREKSERREARTMEGSHKREKEMLKPEKETHKQEKSKKNDVISLEPEPASPTSSKAEGKNGKGKRSKQESELARKLDRRDDFKITESQRKDQRGKDSL